jgi:hypothetical protein
VLNSKNEGPLPCFDKSIAKCGACSKVIKKPSHVNKHFVILCFHYNEKL